VRAAVTDLTQRLMSVVAILAVCGIAVSSVSLQHHYATSKTAYCDIGETFNCDIVNRSEYSSVMGIPVAGIGIAGYGVLLALATRDAPHLLILDEPTNHLDIDARDALVRALAEFEGAVLLISHDPYLVDLVADRLLLVADGKVTALDGDLKSYAASVTEGSSSNGGGSRDNSRKNDRADSKKERAEARSKTAPLRQAVKDAELRLTKLNAERGLLEKKLADPGIYAPGKAKDLTYINQRIAAIKRETDGAERDWLAAEAALEAVI